MTDAAVIRGTFADLKTVRTRGAVQLVIEIPIEQGARAVEIFGFPQPGAEVPVAVARLVEQPKPQPVEDKPKPRRPFHERPRSHQAGILCNNPDFQRWIHIDPFGEDPAERAAQYVRDRCGVLSRADLDPPDRNPNGPWGPAEKWDRLLTQFEQATGRIAENRS